MSTRYVETSSIYVLEGWDHDPNSSNFQKTTKSTLTYSLCHIQNVKLKALKTSSAFSTAATHLLLFLRQLSPRTLACTIDKISKKKEHFLTRPTLGLLLSTIPITYLVSGKSYRIDYGQSPIRVALKCTSGTQRPQ